MNDLTEYNLEEDCYTDDMSFELDNEKELELDDAIQLNMGLGNARKIALQNHTARLKIEQMQERIRLRKLLEEEY